MTRQPIKRTKSLDDDRETELIQQIMSGVAEAEKDDRVVDVDTARRIAACVHRGLGGELERFAGSGELKHPHAARLELFHSTDGEPSFLAWREALKDFINEHARGKRKLKRQPGKGKVRPVSVTVGVDSITKKARSGAASPGQVLARANPRVAQCSSCNPEGAVVYLRIKTSDRIKRTGVGLHSQLRACRRYVKQRLRKRLEATFADDRDSPRQGFLGLLGRLAACHNRRVIVQRLDRLDWAQSDLDKVAEMDARVLSVSDTNSRRLHSQKKLAEDITSLHREKTLVKEKAC